jgi:transposase
MCPARNGPPLSLTGSQRLTLERWVRARTTPQRVVLRSAIVLLASQGLPATAIAARLGTSRSTVQLWCRRFRADGPAVLLRDRPGRGRKRTVGASDIARALEDARSARLSVRQLAQRLGASASAVHRALAAHRQFRNSGDER